jgi:hypothetical protein
MKNQQVDQTYDSMNIFDNYVVRGWSRLGSRLEMRTETLRMTMRGLPELLAPCAARPSRPFRADPLLL